MITLPILRVVSGGRARDTETCTHWGPESIYKGNWLKALEDHAQRERFAREVRQGQHFQIVEGKA